MRVAMLVLGLLACGGSKVPTATLTIGEHPLTVEIAATEGDRARGLMHRDELAADRGMIFVYPDDAVRRFWMKDTRIPLSIAFVDRHGKIVRIADMTPFSTERTTSLYPARYAIEVNEGWFAAQGIAPGVTVRGLEALPTPE